MVKVYKPAQARFLKALIYSPTGHGKTYFLGTAQEDPRTHPMLLLSFEGGESTLSGLDIDVVRIRDWDDYNEAYALLADEKTPYKSVGLDSISETHVFALLNYLATEVAKRDDPNLLQLQDYNRASVQMRKLVRAFRDLPMHVFLTSLAKDEIEPRVGQVRKPSLAGVMAEEIPGMMDVLGYLALATSVNEKSNQEETHRLMILQNYDKVRAKVRTPWGTVAPNELMDPTVTSLLDAVGFPSTETPKIVPPPKPEQAPIETKAPGLKLEPASTKKKE